MKRKGIACLISLVLTLCILFAGCQRAEKISEQRDAYSLNGIEFDMLRLPAMQFPGGAMGIRLLTERRSEYIGVKKPFSLAETNTSYRLWKDVYQWAIHHGYTFNREGLMGSQKDGDGMNDLHPVTLVDWTSAVLWCNALTEYYNLTNNTSFRPVYEYKGAVVRSAASRAEADAIVRDDNADGFRLPMAMEWELAARYTTKNKDGKYSEYPLFSGIYWIPFRVVSGDIEGTPGLLGAEHGRILSIPVGETQVNDLGFYGFAGPEGKLWQWCFDYLGETKIDTYHIKRGGSRYPRCSPNYNWPKTKWSPTCTGYTQITFRFARNSAE